MLVILLILIVSLAGCVDSGSENPVLTPTVPETAAETAIISTHGIGEKVSDGRTEITLSGVRYAKNINNSRADEGNQ
ncbi:MAG TPA: hypothetical protein VIO11_09590, partial [Candidatus Methanoperedens sp.]